MLSFFGFDTGGSTPRGSSADSPRMSVGLTVFLTVFLIVFVD